VRLTDDGLATVGAVRHVYDPWRYPDDWDVESFSPEGPKITRRGDWFFMVTAVGGTAGPPTSHMVIVARSRSVFGPWENHPDNPLVRTRDRSEPWWSKGHATFIEGPAGDWWTVYHGYENGYWTLGRQTLLEPVVWRADGWPVRGGGDLSQPLAGRRAGGQALPHGAALSDDFSRRPVRRAVELRTIRAPDEAGAVRQRGRCAAAEGGRGLAATTARRSPSSRANRRMRSRCEIEVDPGVTAGVLLFYDSALYAGLGFDAKRGS
jgi:xylan 1,4-beta-xylosidase